MSTSRSTHVPGRRLRAVDAAVVPTAFLLAPAARLRLEQHLVEALPAEGCGLLGGQRRDHRLLVTEFMPLANRAGATDRFTVDPLEFLQAAEAMHRHGVGWLGFAHGHPNGSPTPSHADAVQLWRGCLQVVGAPIPAGSCPLQAFWSLPTTAAQAAFLPLALVEWPAATAAARERTP